MSWLPREAPAPHRLDGYAFRAGVLLDPDGEDGGYVLVLPEVYWQQIGGHLWWRRWGRPRVGADVWVSAQAVERSFEEGWFTGDLLDEMLDLWDTGRVAVRRGLDYEVTWLDREAPAVVARDAFATDLDEELRRRSGAR